MRIEAVDAEHILPVRHAVLRAGLPVEAARFAEDTHAQTLHLAAIESSGEVVGCATLLPEPIDGEDAWRLRGMAVVETHRGRRIGSALLQAVDRHAQQHARNRTGTALLWCNAREVALPFYERHGWTVISDRFLSDLDIPHYRMRKRIAAHARC